MKLGSSDRVDDVFRQGSAGLKFVHEPQPPSALPVPAGQVYFRIHRDPLDAEWQHVQKSLTLAVRVNENFIAGSIQGQRLLERQSSRGRRCRRAVSAVRGAEVTSDI